MKKVGAEIFCISDVMIFFALIQIRGQSPSSMGESFFFPCTRHVSMYLHPGIVILKFCLSVPQGIIFISVLSH